MESILKDFKLECFILKFVFEKIEFENVLELFDEEFLCFGFIMIGDCYCFCIFCVNVEK